jgi:TRAP-type C4-dicarboxylate transport system substrate-binding protein
MGSRGRIALTAALLILGAAPTAMANDRTGNETPAGSTVLHALSVFGEDTTVPYTDAVTQLSGGALKFDLQASFGDSDPDREAQIIAAVRSGSADVGIVASRAINSTGVTAFDALQAPFVITSYKGQADVLRSPIVDEMASALVGSGVNAVGVLPGANRYIFSVDGPMVDPVAFAGRTVMVSRSSVSSRIFNALGATTIDQLTPAADAGFDATEAPLDSILGTAAAAKYLLANVIFEPRPIVVLINEAKAATLSESERAILHDAAVNSIDTMISGLVGSDNENLGIACRRLAVLNASDQQREALAAAEQPVIDQIDGSGSYLGEIRKVVGAQPAPAAVDCGSLASGGSPATQTPVDGVWKTCPTVQQIMDAGGDPAEADLNAGCSTFTFRGGVFQESGPQSAGPQPGRYSVAGNLLTIDRANGEHFVFTWTLLGDRLSLADGPAGSISPSPMRAIPWERTGDATASAAPALKSPIDGVWSACPTAQQILDVGGDAGDATNAGCFTMTLRDGIYYEGSGQNVGPRAGTYTVDGNLLTIDRDNGEHFAFTWTRLGDRLSLDYGPAGSISPAPSRAVPFDRIGD